VGYIETLKAYRIYIPGKCHIEVSCDVTFDEEVSFRSSRESHMEIDSEEHDDMKDMGIDPSIRVVNPSYYQEDSLESVDLPINVVITRKRPSWIHETLQDEEGHASPSGTCREIK
jgi:hypothetical protein